jgi:hypothetical protein
MSGKPKPPPDKVNDQPVKNPPPLRPLPRPPAPPPKPTGKQMI